MKRFIPYPLLLITSIVLDRVSVSVMQINAAQSVRPLFVMLVATFSAILIVHQFIKDWYRTDFIILMVMLVLVVYRSLYEFFQTISPFHADALGLLLIPLTIGLYSFTISNRVWQFIKKPVQLTNYFNIVFSLLLIFQAVRFAGLIPYLLTNNNRAHTSAIPPLSEELHLTSTTKPDIYVIILDAYGTQGRSAEDLWI